MYVSSKSMSFNTNSEPFFLNASLAEPVQDKVCQDSMFLKVIDIQSRH